MGAPIFDNADHPQAGSVDSYSGKTLSGSITSQAGLGYIWRTAVNGQKVWFIVDAMSNSSGQLSGFTGRFVVPFTNPPDGRYTELALVGVNSAGRMIYAATDGSGQVWDTGTNQLRAATAADAVASGGGSNPFSLTGTLFTVGNVQVKTWMAAAAALGLLAMSKK